MAYIGQGIKGGTFSVLDTSGNTYNGSNVTFNLGTQVGSPAQLLVSHDGVIQKPVTDYTIATGGTQITFTTAPASGASIFITEISGAVGAPMNRDINGDELILDADADTSITADTDDQIDIRIAGADDFQFTANTFTAQSGSTIAGQAITATTVVGSGAAQFATAGIGAAKDLGVALHVKSGDSGATPIASADELIVEGSASAGISILTGNDDNGYLCFGDDGDADIGNINYRHDINAMRFNTNAAERMQIDSSGRVCIGHSSGAHIFHVNKDVGGDAVAAIENANDTNPQGLDLQFTAGNPDNNTQYAIHFGVVTAGTKFIVYSDGDVQNHDNSYGATSDQRIKDNIADATSQWDDIKALKVRKFKLKDDIREYGADKAKYKIGLVAQEAEAVSPNLINECSPGINDIKSDSTFGTLYEDGDVIPDGKKVGEIKEEKAKVKSLKYSILYMKAIKALQEAQTRIETLETKVKTLEDA